MNKAQVGEKPAARFAQVSNDTLKVRVYNEMRRALMSGTFEPGQAMVVRAIAEEMDVGIMPVRESIQQLVNEGALEVLPHRTASVPILGADDLEEIFSIRKALEGMATELAASRITPEELDRLEELLPKAAAPNETTSPIDSQRADWAFHFTIYEAARAPHLKRIIEGLWLKVGPLLIAPYHAEGEGARGYFGSADLHIKLVEALRMHSSERARGLMRGIIDHSLQWYLNNTVR